MKIVVVSPHRDDAAFSVGLAIGAWLAAGHTVEVLDCFTRSQYAPFSDAESVHPNDRLSFVTAVRAREDLAWTKLYRGAATRLTLRDLRLKDVPIRLRAPLAELCGFPVAPTDKAIGAIQKGLSQAGPNAVVLPLAVGRHVDHVTAMESALPSSVGGVPCAFYEDLPYAAREEAAAGLEAIALQASVALGEPLSPVFASPELSDPAVAVERKRRMAEVYDSQIDTDVVGRIAGFCLRYGGRERLWANAAWLRQGPAPETAAS